MPIRGDAYDISRQQAVWFNISNTKTYLHIISNISTKFPAKSVNTILRFDVDKSSIFGTALETLYGTISQWLVISVQCKQRGN